MRMYLRVFTAIALATLEAVYTEDSCTYSVDNRNYNFTSLKKLPTMPYRVYDTETMYAFNLCGLPAEFSPMLPVTRQHVSFRPTYSVSPATQQHASVMRRTATQQGIVRRRDHINMMKAAKPGMESSVHNPHGLNPTLNVEETRVQGDRPKSKMWCENHKSTTHNTADCRNPPRDPPRDDDANLRRPMPPRKTRNVPIANAEATPQKSAGSRTSTRGPRWTPT